jgi:hypothetical protein
MENKELRWEELANIADEMPKESPKEKIERLAGEWSRVISDARFGHRGDRHHFEDSLFDILSAHKELLVTAREIAEENEKLKAEVPLGLSIARGERLD